MLPSRILPVWTEQIEWMAIDLRQTDLLMREVNQINETKSKSNRPTAAATKTLFHIISLHITPERQDAKAPQIRFRCDFFNRNATECRPMWDERKRFINCSGRNEKKKNVSSTDNDTRQNDSRPTAFIGTVDGSVTKSPAMMNQFYVASNFVRTRARRWFFPMNFLQNIFFVGSIEIMNFG